LTATSRCTVDGPEDALADAFDELVAAEAAALQFEIRVLLEDTLLEPLQFGR
jgi:hypothetical protein